MAEDEQEGGSVGKDVQSGTPAPEASGPVEDGGEPVAGPREGEAHPHFVEVWNDYDPSQRFAAIFPVGEREGATASSVAYYIIEPGKHTGVHHDNAEEIAFVAEGEGEVFMIGQSRRLQSGTFAVFPAGAGHDIYAMGGVALRLLSFFPTTEIVSTFQQMIYPVGTTELSSKPPQPLVHELDPSNLPEGFPFTLEELGMAGGGEDQPQELSETQRLLGMTEPGVPPREVKTIIYTPGEGKVEEFVTRHDPPPDDGAETAEEERPEAGADEPDAHATPGDGAEPRPS
jgi:uncharacterized cupin superfamily protein